jgi:hypothetical protein
MCAIDEQCPIWDSRTSFGDTNLLVTNMDMARNLAGGTWRPAGCADEGTWMRDRGWIAPWWCSMRFIWNQR